MNPITNCFIDLANYNGVSVFVAVIEVLLPVANIYAHERNIYPVLLHQVRAVLTVFIAVPIVIVVVLAVVIASFTVMVVSHGGHRRKQGGSRQERAEN
jgi:hypothetical protein